MTHLPAAPAQAPRETVERVARLKACTILIVDDEEANLDLLQGLLEAEGYTRVLRTNDARQVLPLVQQHAPDLVLLDLNMPHRHGLDVLTDLRAITPPGDYRPVLVLTADVTWETRERALSCGARDFVTKPFDATEVMLRVENLLEARVLHAAEAQARARAEEATRERERLLAIVAHDLRNPLAVVSMFAETLEVQGVAAAGTHPADEAHAWIRGAVATIHANAVSMQRLVEDLLDASSIRGDGLRIHRTAQRIGDAFESAERMLRPLADAAGVALEVHADDGAADAVGSFDRERLVQVLSNLVGNAVKFTPRGGTVTVRYRVGHGTRGGILEGVVADTGPGIAPDELPHLFTAFWTGQRREGNAGRHGAGLGLWIARGIVDAHGGTMRVTSPPGEGATFHFTIPLDQPADA